MSSTFVTRLKVGEILVDAKGVSRLVSRRVGIWPLVTFAGAGITAIVVAVAASPALRNVFLDFVDVLPGSRACHTAGAVFDLRYHVASLAAVFLALVIGILVGVGISGRGFIDDAERDPPERRDRRAPRGARGRGRRDRRPRAPPGGRAGVRRERLPGRRPGPARGQEDRGARGRLVRLDARRGDGGGRAGERRRRSCGSGRCGCRCRSRRSSRRCRRSEDFGGYVGEDELGNLGRDLGRELVAGGETPLWDALAPDLVEQRAFDELRGGRRRRRRPVGRAAAAGDGALPRRPLLGRRQPRQARRRRRAVARPAERDPRPSSATRSRPSTGSTRPSGGSRSCCCSAGANPRRLRRARHRRGRHPARRSSRCPSPTAGG